MQRIRHLGAGSELSDTETVTVTGIILPFTLPMRLGETEAEVITGGTVSLTRRVVEAVALFPAASVTVTWMVVWPLTRVPAAGDCTFVRAFAGVTLSETTNWLRISGTTAWPLLSGVALTDAGATTDGGVLSTTVKLVEAVAVLPAASVTVTVTRVDPTPTRVPAAGCCAFSRAAAGVQLSEATRPARKSG